MSDMLNEPVLTVRAGDLQRVLKAVVPRTRGHKGLKAPLTLAYLREEGEGREFEWVMVSSLALPINKG